MPPTFETPANFISSDVEIEGTVSFGQSLTVHGKIIGDVRAPGVLTVGPTGSVQGNINAGSVSIHGIVKGDVTVADRCELKGAARLIGDLVAPRLIMEDGATFAGMCKVGPIAQGEAERRARAA